MTLIRRPPIIIPVESIIGALAVARSIHSQLEIDSTVTWPNDVVVQGSKVAGLIVEGH
jgi:biotin-(acetyl-CoA carboxylase) ligase